MPTRRDVRRAAFQALYQLDATDGAAESSLDEIVESVTEEEGGTALPARDRRAAVELALGAWRARSASDATMNELAPAWPAHRQASVDRAILRIAHYEMTAGLTPPKAAINEAVELAKAFSTEKSPAFVNGLLDKVLKRVEASRHAAGAMGDAPAPEGA